MTQHLSQTSSTDAAVLVATGQQERRQGVSPSGAGVGPAPASVGLSGPAVAAGDPATGGNPKRLTLSKQAVGALTAARANYHPHGKTDGSLRQAPSAPAKNPAIAGFFEHHTPEAPRPDAEIDQKLARDAAKHPPFPSAAPKGRRSRARETSPEMSAFLARWFFDYLAATIPNTVDGKGIRRRAAKDRPDIAEDLAGQAEAREAVERMCRWAVAEGLRKIRLTKGSDGYRAGINYGASPVDAVRLATIRDGHVSNMPGLEIPGGDGACARLAPSALLLLGPVNAARIDVSWDHSQEGYFDDLYAYAMDNSTAKNRPVLIDRGSGRTFTWTRGDVKLKVYEKDFERFARKKIAKDDVDENLVRVEFGFHPTKPADKAAYARLARDEGPGALLGSVHWVRRMVEYIATLTGQLKPEAAQMAVARLDRLPVSATVEDRARYGLSVYGRMLCNAAMARIVIDKFGGDWLAAKVEPEQVRDGVLGMVGAYIDGSGAHEWAVSAAGVDRARTINEEADRNGEALQAWLERQDSETEESQRVLAEAHEQAIRLDDRRDEFEAAVAEAAEKAKGEGRAEMAEWVHEQRQAAQQTMARAKATVDQKAAAVEAAAATARVQARQMAEALQHAEAAAKGRIMARALLERQKVREGYKRADERVMKAACELARTAAQHGIELQALGRAYRPATAISK